MLLKLGTGVLAMGLGVTATAGLAVDHYGTAWVKVEEKFEGGNRFSFPVPLALVRLGVTFVPSGELGPEAEHLELASELASAVAEQLADYPDQVFVQVEDGRESVLVATRGGSIFVDVNSPEEHVQVQVPLWGAAQILEVLANKASSE